MKGLEAYLNKHGKHFTEKLAMSITEGRWNGNKVKKAAQRKVYYNVTGSTLGDMVFLTNMVYFKNAKPLDNFNKCIDYMLMCVANFELYGGVTFEDWLEIEGDFDFTPYI